MKIHTAGLMLAAAICWASPISAEPNNPRTNDDLKVTRKVSVLEIASEKYAVTTTYRGGVRILEKVMPPNDARNNTVYYVYLSDI